jgi:glycosyltransferase involved in cell wall biosynthesis
VFTGTMNYWPNEDAVIWFSREVMPLLRGRRDAPEFYIVGGNPTRHVLKLAAEPGVHVTGRVPDTRPYMAHASVVVAPLRVARGIQNKVLEAMAMGRPVVASPEAFEGVRARPGCELLVAAGAARTAQAIGELLDGRHPGLGAAARTAIERHYDWSATLKPLDILFAEPPPCLAPATRRSEVVA